MNRKIVFKRSSKNKLNNHDNYDRYKPDSKKNSLEIEHEKIREMVYKKLNDYSDDIEISDELQPDKVYELIQDKYKKVNKSKFGKKRNENGIFYKIYTKIYKKIEAKFTDRLIQKVIHVLSVTGIIFVIFSFIFLGFVSLDRTIIFHTIKVKNINSTEINQVTDKIKPAESKKEIIAVLHSSQLKYYKKAKDNIEFIKKNQPNEEYTKTYYLGENDSSENSSDYISNYDRKNNLDYKIDYDSIAENKADKNDMYLSNYYFQNRYQRIAFEDKDKENGENNNTIQKVGDYIFFRSNNLLQIDIIDLKTGSEGTFSLFPESDSIKENHTKNIVSFYCFNNRLYVIKSAENIVSTSDSYLFKEVPADDNEIEDAKQSHSNIYYNPNNSDNVNKNITDIMIYDITDSMKPVYLQTVSIDGYYIGSTIKNDQMVVFTNKSLCKGAEFKDNKLYYRTENNLPRINEKEIDPKSVYITDTTNINSFLVLTSIDLSQAEFNYKAMAFLTSNGSLVAKKDDLYLLNINNMNESKDLKYYSNNTKLLKFTYKDKKYEPVSMTEVEGGVYTNPSSFNDNNIILFTQKGISMNEFLNNKSLILKLDNNLDIISQKEFSGTICDTFMQNNKLYIQISTISEFKVKAIQIPDKEVIFQEMNNTEISNCDELFLNSLYSCNDMKLVVSGYDNYIYNNYYSNSDNIQENDSTGDTDNTQNGSDSDNVYTDYGYSSTFICLYRETEENQIEKSSSLKFKDMALNNQFLDDGVIVDNENQLIGLSLVDQTKHHYTNMGVGDAVFELCKYSQDGTLKKVFKYELGSENLDYDNFTGIEYYPYFENKTLYLYIPYKGLQIVNLEDYSLQKYIPYS